MFLNQIISVTSISEHQINISNGKLWSKRKNWEMFCCISTWSFQKNYIYILALAISIWVTIWVKTTGYWYNYSVFTSKEGGRPGFTAVLNSEDKCTKTILFWRKRKEERIHLMDLSNINDGILVHLECSWSFCATLSHSVGGLTSRLIWPRAPKFLILPLKCKFISPSNLGWSCCWNLTNSLKSVTLSPSISISAVVWFHLFSYTNVRERDCSLPLPSMLGFFFFFFMDSKVLSSVHCIFPSLLTIYLQLWIIHFFQAGIWMPAENPFWNMMILINIAKYKIHHWWYQLINPYYGKTVGVNKLFICICLSIVTAMPKNWI